MDIYRIIGYFVLMAFSAYAVMSLSMLLSKIPDLKQYRPFRISQEFIGMAFAIIAVKYTVVWFFLMRGVSGEVASLVSLPLYYMIYVILGIASVNIFKHDIDKVRVIRNNVPRLVAIFIVAVIGLSLPRDYRWIALLTGKLGLAAYVIMYTRKFSSAMKLANASASTVYSKELSRFISWVSKCVGMWAILGLAGCVVVFLPAWIYALFVAVAVVGCFYIFVSFQSYMSLYEMIEANIQEAKRRYGMRKSKAVKPEADAQAVRNRHLGEMVQMWIDLKGFTQQGVNIESLALRLGTNRSYLSDYINHSYGLRFNEWLGGLRIDFAQRLMITDESITLDDVATSSGFSSGSYFTKLFIKTIGLPPSEWRKQHLKQAMMEAGEDDEASPQSSAEGEGA